MPIMVMPCENDKLFIDLRPSKKELMAFKKRVQPSKRQFKLIKK